MASKLREAGHDNGNNLLCVVVVLLVRSEELVVPSILLDVNAFEGSFSIHDDRRILRCVLAVGDKTLVDFVDFFERNLLVFGEVPNWRRYETRDEAENS